MGEPMINQQKPEILDTKIPGTDIQTRWTLVTPELAKVFLDCNTSNRSKKEKHLMRLTSDMEKGLYQITHEGVAFDEKGVMIDGQHRCMAILRSNKSQWMLVTTGLPTEAKEAVDIGTKRTVADFREGKNRFVHGGAVRMMITLRNMSGSFTAASVQSSRQGITNAEIHENWDTWPLIGEWSELAAKAAKNTSMLTPVPLLLAAVMFPDTGEEFLNGLITMSGLPENDPRLSLLKYRGTPGQRTMQQGSAIYLAVKAAKAFNEGQQIKSLRLSQTDLLTVKVP